MQTVPPLVSVEQRIEAATRALGYFERSHIYNEFQSVLLTLLEVNGTDSAAAPLNENWQLREGQIKDAYGVWFLIFRTLDGMKLANYNPLAPENRCYLNVAPRVGFPEMDPSDVQDAEARREYRKKLVENQIRCERNSLQLLLPRLDLETQAALHKFLVNLSTPDRDTAGSYFAYALAKSGIGGDRSTQMWAIFERKTDANWHPSAGQNDGAIGDEYATFPLNEGITPKEAKAHLAEWLESGDARTVAWAAHYALRDKNTAGIPLLLAYLHKHAFDPVFEAGADYSRDYWPEVRDATDAMAAALDALIVFRAQVPPMDLLQIVQVLPDHALILGIIPAPQEEVLEYIYMTGGVKHLRQNEHYRAVRSDPSSAADFMRWVAAANVLVNRESRGFAQHVFDDFTLNLHLLVVDENSGFMGGGGCGEDQTPGRERDLDWPPVGAFGFLIPNVAERGFHSGVEAGETEPQGELIAPGGIAVKLIRRVTRSYGYAQYAPPCPRIPPADVRAHWLEKMGTGSYGKGRSFDPWNPGAEEPVRSTSQKRHDFQFCEIIRVKDENDHHSEFQLAQRSAAVDEQGYHAKLKAWIAAQHEVYREIVEGLAKKSLITEEQVKRPLRMAIYGIDSRSASAHSNSTPLTKAPWEDLTPRDTEISWVGQP